MTTNSSATIDGCVWPIAMPPETDAHKHLNATAPCAKYDNGNENEWFSNDISVFAL